MPANAIVRTKMHPVARTGTKKKKKKEDEKQGQTGMVQSRPSNRLVGQKVSDLSDYIQALAMPSPHLPSPLTVNQPLLAPVGDGGTGFAGPWSTNMLSSGRHVSEKDATPNFRGTYMPEANSQVSVRQIDDVKRSLGRSPCRRHIGFETQQKIACSVPRVDRTNGGYSILTCPFIP